MKIELPEAFCDLLVPKRYKIYYGGRGAAKSRSFGIAALIKGMERKRGILCARELQVSIADSVHSLLDQEINKKPEFKAFYKPTLKEVIGVNGSFFIFKGLKHNINEIKSTEGIDICWVEEAQAVSDKSWETLIPTIREEGSEIWISFNTKNPTDPTYQRFVLKPRENAIVKKVSYRDNPFFPSVLEQERIELQRDDPEAYQHVWEGEFDTRYSGSVYAKYVNQSQISDKIVYDPNRPIYTAWDLGYDDATAVIFYQLARDEIHIIDYYESNFEDIQHYCEVLYGAKIKVDTRSPETGKILKWHFTEYIDEERGSYDYTGGKHFVPHDAAYKLQAAQGRSIVEQAAEFDISLEAIDATNQQNSEQALRKALPKCWFNADRTKDLVLALMNYHYDYDDDKKIYSKVPVHDWSSHGCDAMELMARMWQHSAMSMNEIKSKQRDAMFYHNRRKYNVDKNEDPYRLKKVK